ncbi:LmeA family phospholipid-binding protein [Schumannella soli]|uniref:DUF2993 domain-containing protein n=1 Tax=Schumannella soli TaxID=2590779 RepID=A0A506Y240_9MICO|nr:DUF2993 domain-containing protein [Schumannella soli]TPW75963.1 DUF2993 domain-containing protein [Schumannella soli]
MTDPADRPEGAPADSAASEPTAPTDPSASPASADTAAPSAPVESVAPLPPAVVESAASASPRPRRRGRRILIGVVAAVVVVLIALVVVAETAGRAVAAGVVRDKVVAALDQDPSSRVDVDLGGGSLVLQALGGEVDRVKVDLPEARVANVTGPLRLEAQGVPIRGGGAADSVTATFVVGKEQAAGFADYFQNAGFDSVVFAGDHVELGASLSLLGQRIPVAVDLSVGAAGGALVFTPTTVNLGGTAIDLADVADSPFGSALGKYLGPKTYCVNEQLPAGIGLQSAVMKGGDVTLRFGGRDVALAGGSAKGACS